MKILLSVLSLSLITVFSGCEQKAASVSNQTAPVTEAAPKATETLTPVKETNKKATRAESSQPVATETTAKTAPRTEVQTPRATEQSLAEISTHGREVTKTQTSKARTRAQAAEDDMMKDLSSDK